MGRSVKRPATQAVIGQRLRAQREAQGLSQMALAEMCGMHFTFVSSVERGERNISVATLLRMAEGLGINPSVIVDGLRWTDRR